MPTDPKAISEESESNLLHQVPCFTRDCSNKAWAVGLDELAFCEECNKKITKMFQSLHDSMPRHRKSYFYVIRNNQWVPEDRV